MRVIPTWSIIRQPVFNALLKNKNIHSHPHWEIGCVLSGKAEIELETETKSAKTGECFVLSPGIPHTDKRTTSPTPIIAYLGLEITSIPGCGIGYTAFSENVNCSFRSIFSSIATEMSQKKENWQEVLNSEIKKLLIYLDRQHRREEVTGESIRTAFYREMVEKWQQWAKETCFDPDFRIAPNGTVGTISIRHFQTIFRRQTGIPCKVWVDHLRIERASELLISRERAISQIAAACGYKNVYHFSKRFKAKTGISPARYRLTIKI